MFALRFTNKDGSHAHTVGGDLFEATCVVFSATAKASETLFFPFFVERRRLSFTSLLVFFAFALAPIFAFVFLEREECPVRLCCVCTALSAKRYEQDKNKGKGREEGWRLTSGEEEGRVGLPPPSCNFHPR